MGLKAFANICDTDKVDHFVTTPRRGLAVLFWNEADSLLQRRTRTSISDDILNSTCLKCMQTPLAFPWL